MGADRDIIETIQKVDRTRPSGEHLHPSDKKKIIRTVCHRDCPDTCFVDAIVEDGVLTHTKGSDKNPITQGFLCPRGVGDPARVYSRERVLYPHVKSDGSFRRVSWPEACDLVASTLKSTLEKSGRGSVLHYDYAGNQGFLAWQYPQRLWRGLGVTVTDGALCSASGHDGIGLHYGLAYGRGFLDVLESDAIVFWGNNARVSSPHLWALSLKARAQRGAILISIDPRESETAQGSDFSLHPQPGSDVALFYGISRCLIQNGGVDMGFVDEWTKGFDELKGEVTRWTPERVEEVTGLSWESVEKLGDVLAEHRPAVFMIGLGLNKSSHGAEAARAASLLPALLGRHRGFHYSDSRGRFTDWGYINGGALSGMECAVTEQVSLGGRLASGDFRFVFFSNANPAATLPDQNAVRTGLARDDVFVVVHDTHWTETARLADVVLPAATYLEKTDVNFSDHHRYARLSLKAVEPLGESGEEIWLMRELARRLDCQKPFLFEDPWHALDVGMKQTFEDGTLDDLRRGAVLTLRQHPREEYQTPSGKIEFFSSVAHGRGASSLPQQLPLECGKGELVLLNSALPEWTHSQFRDVYGPIPQVVWINPEDASRHGIAEGDEVALENELGSVVVSAEVTEGISPGALWSPRPLTGKNGVSLNALASGSPQSIGKGPRFNSIRVRIRKC